MLWHLFKIIILLCLITNNSWSKEFIVQAKKYDIVEEDAMLYIKKKLMAMQNSGEIAKLQKKWQENSVKSAKRPKDATQIVKYRNKTNIRYYDPSIRVTNDLKNHEGKIFAKAGTIINPLARVGFYQPRLLFIDGDKKEHINFAHKLYQEKKDTKIILVRGNIIDIMKSKKIRLFFDQNGVLVKKFNLQYFPSLITRENDLLKITEIAL